MPSLLTFPNGPVTCINLTENAFWRIGIGVVGDEYSGFNMAVTVVYPPAGPGNIIALAKGHVRIAKDAGSLQKVAAVALDGGNLDADVARTTEALNLFRNDPKIKAEHFDEAVKVATKILTVYWQIKDWIISGMKDQINITMDESIIHCVP